MCRWIITENITAKLGVKSVLPWPYLEISRKFMMTSSNGNIFRVTGHLCGEFTGPGEFPAQRPVTRSFDAFFDLRLNKRLSKQPWGWWFETPPWSLWHHCNVPWMCQPLHSMKWFPLLSSPSPLAIYCGLNTAKSWSCRCSVGAFFLIR